MGGQRRAKLKPEFRSLYPELPVNQWLPAWGVATRRAETVWRDSGADALVQGRLLSDEHFEFRGGEPRPVDWYVIPERLSDPERSEVGLENW